MSEEPADEPYAGLATRGVAFALDAAVINSAAILVGVAVGLALSVLSIPDGTETLLLAIGGGLYVLWATAYFVAFWSTTGQTVGSRVMQIRVRESQVDGPLRARRAFVRLIGTTLAAIPLLAGFMPILVDARRRGFHDWLARSVVVHVDEDEPIPTRGVRTRPASGARSLARRGRSRDTRP